MTSIVNLPYEYFFDPDSSRPISNGFVYVGVIDLDPEIPANQLPVTLRQEDGTEVIIDQSITPIRTGVGGGPEYNGSPVQVLVDVAYSIKVLDSLGAQKFYSANVADGVPLTTGTGVSAVTFLADLIALDVTVVKQVSVSGRTVAGDGFEGDFNFIQGNQSVNVTADPLQGIWVAPASDPTGASGAWKRDDQGLTNVKNFGAKGDGATDDTAAIQAAINTGNTVLVPSVTSYYKITAALVLGEGQKIVGEGWGSTIRQTTASLNVIESVTKNNQTIEGLHLYATGTLSGISDGQGIHLNGCAKCKVINNFIENHRGKGIGLKDTSNSKVLNNILVNSPVSDTDLHSSVQADIGVYYSSSRNIVSGNHCLSGNGIGITVQTITSGDACDDNIVSNNIIDGSRMYGMQAYKLNAADSLLRTKFIGNSVKNISGITEHTTDGFVFGAGCYIQGAEYSIVSNNTFENTNINTVVDQLAPGAVGTTNVTNISISNNTITNANWFGITCRDPNASGLSDGFANITGNNIVSSTKSGIEVKERGRVNIRGNTIDDSTVYGISIDNSVANDPLIMIVDNVVRSSANNSIRVRFASQIGIINNTVDTSSVSGIDIGDADDVRIVNNLVKGCTVRGINVSTNVTSVDVISNNCNGNGVGMLIQSPAQLLGNRVESNTTDWQGNYQIKRTLGTGAASYSVEGAVGVLVPTDGTSITNLTGGEDGQIITLIGTGTRTFNDTSVGTGQMILATNFAMTSGDTLRLEYWGTAWYEISRSVN